MSHFVQIYRALTMTALVGAAIAAPAQTANMTPQDLYQYLSPSVWVVRTYDEDGLSMSTGSAVVTGPETLLTNCHVLKSAKRFTVRNGNVLHGARLQHIDLARDMCQITARSLQAPAVALADSDQLSVGQKVYALGSPRGLELTLSDGLISALRRDEDDQLVRIQTSAPISHGSSGGGLFDGGGRLIGITTSGVDDAQNLNFAIPINWQRDLAARSDAALRAARSTPTAQVPSTPPVPSVGMPPPAMGSATLEHAELVPAGPKCKEAFRKYVVAREPKAYALSAKGHCSWASGQKPGRPEVSVSPDPSVRAMELCLRSNSGSCSLYAVGSSLVIRR